jgi:hypothetical protein
MHRKNFRIIVISTVLFLFFQAPAFAGMEADFYVSPAGNDSWLGTLPAANATHSNGP